MFTNGTASSGIPVTANVLIPCSLPDGSPEHVCARKMRAQEHVHASELEVFG